MKINLCSKIINLKSLQIPHTILPGGGVTALQTGETSGRRCVRSFLTEMMLIMLMMLVMMIVSLVRSFFKGSTKKNGKV